MDLHISPEQADEYAIGSLEPELEKFVQLHIRDCPSCAELVADAELVAANFALTAPLRRAPLSMRDDVMVGAGISRPTLVSRLPSVLQAVAGIAAVAIAVAALVGMFLMRSQVHDLRNDNAALESRVADIASQDVEIFLLTQRLNQAESTTTELQAAAERDNELLAALLSPNSQVAQVTTTRGNSSVGRFIWEDDQSRIWFVAQRLPKLPENQTYQIWLRSNGKYVSLGTFNADDSGSVMFRRFVSEGLDSYDAAVVTIETRGGSPQREGESVFYVANLNNRSSSD